MEFCHSSIFYSEIMFTCVFQGVRRHPTTTLGNIVNKILTIKRRGNKGFARGWKPCLITYDYFWLLWLPKLVTYVLLV